MSNKLISHGPAGLIRLQTMNDGPLDVSSVPEDPIPPVVFTSGLFANAGILNSSGGVLSWDATAALDPGSYLINARVDGEVASSTTYLPMDCYIGDTSDPVKYQISRTNLSSSNFPIRFCVPFATRIVLVSATTLRVTVFNSTEYEFAIPVGGIALTYMQVA